MKYSELNLDPVLNSAIEKLNYVDATPIQEQAMPHILIGKDVAGLAQTGTGKTAAFLIPLIERILRTKQDPTHERAFKDWNARSYVLILVPTRELADQINENAVKLCQGTGFKSFPIYGGTGYEKQKEAVAEGLQFLISTPGRLIDLYKENYIDLKQVRAIVFDEADRMFDMGFKDDMKYILGRVPRDRQFLVFSATLNFDVINTAYQFGSEPVEINISRDQAKADNVKDFVIHLGDGEKPQFLLSLFKKQNPKQTMIFTNFKHNVDKVAAFLISNKVSAMGISSLMSQSQRNAVIEKFKAENDQNVLVATDVAARGLDINGVDLVINYEMPQDPESYVHRIGRTGRAGREGQAFSFISDRDIDSLSRVEEYTKKKIDSQFIEEADLIKDFVEFSHREPRVHQHSHQRSGSSSGPHGKPRGQHPGGAEGRPKHAGGRATGGGRDAGGAGGGNRNSGNKEAHRGHNSGNSKHQTSGNRSASAQAGGAPLALPKPNDLSRPHAVNVGGAPGSASVSHGPSGGKNHPHKFHRKGTEKAGHEGKAHGAGRTQHPPQKTNKFSASTGSTAKSFRSGKSARKNSSSLGSKVKSFFKRLFG